MHNWYTQTNPDEDETGFVYDEKNGQDIAEVYNPENARLVASAPKLLDALKRSENNIVQLCNMVNDLAGFKKVRIEDFAEPAREAISEVEN